MLEQLGLPEAAVLQKRLTWIPSPLVDAVGRPVLTAHPLVDGTVRVVLRETSVLRAIQRISAYADHLERVEEPDELRRQLKGAFEHALGHLED